jgi:hypothetical protein
MIVVPTWFLYLGGFSLVVLGILQIQARPREPDATLYQRFVNVGTLWSLTCISVGVGLLLIATGWWTPWFAVAPKRKVGPPKPAITQPATTPARR